METMIIGIAGGTGSGKTTLTLGLKERFGDSVSILYHDNYYKAHDDMPYEERCKLNYDHPDAFDTPGCWLTWKHCAGESGWRAPPTTTPSITARRRRWR